MGKRFVEFGLITIFIFAIVVLVSPASAATGTEEFETSDSSWISGFSSTYDFKTYYFNEISYYDNIDWIRIIPSTNEGVEWTVGGEPNGAQTTFTAKIGTNIIGNGTISYSKNTNYPNGVVVFLFFSDFNRGPYTGGQTVTLTFDSNELYGLRCKNTQYWATLGATDYMFGGCILDGATKRYIACYDDEGAYRVQYSRDDSINATPSSYEKNVKTMASTDKAEIYLGEHTTVKLCVQANITTEENDVDVMLITDRSGSMRQSGWQLIKKENPEYTFNNVSVPRDGWSEVKTFTVESSVDKLTAQVTWNGVPGYEGSKASEVVINLQRPDGTWIFADLKAGPGGKVDPPDSIGRSNEYFSGICSKPQALLVENPEAGTWGVAVGGYNLRPKGHPPDSINADVSVYLGNNLNKTGTILSNEAAKASAKSFIANMDETDRVGYVKFGSYGVLAQSLTYMNTAGKASMQATIDDTGLEGGTKISDGIDIAVNELVSNGREDALKVIVLLTDGQNDNGTTPVLKSAQAAKDANITIFTIGLTEFVNDEMLKEIASNPGYYYYAPTGAQLQGIYNEISSEIKKIASGARVFYVLPANVSYEGNASIAPDINTGDTLQWLVGNLSPDTPWCVEFDVCTKSLSYVEHVVESFSDVTRITVNGKRKVIIVPSDSRVTYIIDGKFTSVPFPEVSIDVRIDFSIKVSEPVPNQQFIGLPVNIQVNVAGKNRGTYSLLCDDYRIGGGGNLLGEETKNFVWIPMSSGKHKISVSANVENYQLEQDVYNVSILIKRVATY
jgi:hypothetical protein